MTWTDWFQWIGGTLIVLAVAYFLIERFANRKRKNGRHDAGTRVNGLGRGKKETEQ